MTHRIKVLENKLVRMGANAKQRKLIMSHYGSVLTKRIGVGHMPAIRLRMSGLLARLAVSDSPAENAQKVRSLTLSIYPLEEKKRIAKLLRRNESAGVTVNAEYSYTIGGSKVNGGNFPYEIISNVGHREIDAGVFSEITKRYLSGNLKFNEVFSSERMTHRATGEPTTLYVSKVPVQFAAPNNDVVAWVNHHAGRERVTAKDLFFYPLYCGMGFVEPETEVIFVYVGDAENRNVSSVWYEGNIHPLRHDVFKSN